jgi:hypothetical protein
VRDQDWFDCFIDFKPEPEGTEYRDLHGDGRGRFTLDLTRAKRTHWSARTVEWLSRWLTSSSDFGSTAPGTPPSRLDPRGEAVCLLGHQLYEALFVNPEHRAVFESRLEQHSHVRFNLRFHPGSEEVARLPWEFLCRPMADGVPQFLSTSTELILSRVVPEPTTITRNGPLHILIAVLQPGAGYATVLPQPTLVAVDQLGVKFDPGDSTPPPAGVRCRWEPMPEPTTYESLRKRLVDPRLPRPDVVHIVGHGVPEGLVFPAEPGAPEEAALAGLDRAASHQIVSGELVATLFDPANGRPPTALVILETCSGGDAGSQVLSTAQQVLRSGACAVVAMQHEVRQEVASRFIAAFYESIGQGNTIGEAVRDGRLGIIGGGDRSKGPHQEPYFGIPIYLVHEKDRRLLESPPVSSATPVAQPTGSEVPVPTLVHPWTCPGCGVQRKKRFCPKCGWSVFCANCKTQGVDVQLDEPYEFCPDCGTSVPPPRQRSGDVVELPPRAS